MKTMSTPARLLNSAPRRCGGVPSDAPKLSFPGLAFTWAINSATVFTGSDAGTTITCGSSETSATGAKAFGS